MSSWIDDLVAKRARDLFDKEAKAAAAIVRKSDNRILKSAVLVDVKGTSRRFDEVIFSKWPGYEELWEKHRERYTQKARREFAEECMPDKFRVYVSEE